MIVVEFYTISKKEKSTKQPNREEATSFSCILKKETSIEDPIIEVDMGLSEAPTYNYAYIPQFNRYYWVTWVNVHPLWRAILHVDVLASFKNIIGNTNLYILRSSATYDGSIIDMMYPTNTNVSTVVSPPQYLIESYLQGGMFVIGCVDKNATFGSISYYALSYNNLGALVTTLLSDSILLTNHFTIQDCSLALQKSLIDPLSYIKSCVFIPYSYTNYTGTTTNLTIWDWEPGISAKKVGSIVEIERTIDIDIPKHPQANTRGNYCNCNPYTDMRLMFAPFGEIPLDTFFLKDKSVLHVTLNTDVTNGQAMLEVRADNDVNYLVHRSLGMVGVNISLSQVGKDYIGGAMGVVGGINSSIGSGISGSIAGVGGGILSALGSALNFITPRLSNGPSTSGTFVTLYPSCRLQSTFYEIVDDDNSHHGRPLCINAKPQDYSGYLLIQDGDIEAPCTSSELQAIKQYLEGGFYYE